MSDRTFVRLRTLLIGAVVLLAAACGNGGTDVIRVQRSDVAVKPTPTPVPTFEHPLTGELFEGTQRWHERSALAIKVENSRMSRPQAGLDEADVVYEELVEGGITRFIAVFHSQGNGRVGPVRSARMVDPDILAPLSPLFAYAGGVPPVVSAVQSSSSITDVSYNRATSAYRRDPGRKAPHNLYVSAVALWSARDGSPPQPQFTFAGEQGSAEDFGEPAGEVTFSFGARSDLIRWRYDSGSYVRFHGVEAHTLEGGTQIAADNVIVQFVDVRDGSIVDIAGQRSPDTVVLGEGDAILFREGRAVQGRWIRSSRSAPTRFVDPSGNDLLLSRGTTWVELLPRGRQVDYS